MSRRYILGIGALALAAACGGDGASPGSVRNDPKDPQQNEQPDSPLEDTLKEAEELGLAENTLPNPDGLDFGAYDLNLIPELNLTLEDAFLESHKDAYKDDPRFKRTDYTTFSQEYQNNQALREGFYTAMGASTEQEKERLDKAVEVWGNQQKLEVGEMGIGVLPGKDGAKYILLLTKMVTEDDQEVIGYRLQRYNPDESSGMKQFMDAFHESFGGSLGCLERPVKEKYA